MLKEVVAEASQALARLDADRLEEMALSCQALNREFLSDPYKDSSLLAQAREAQDEMAVFARILEATRGNLEVLRRARSRQAECLEYSQPLMHSWERAENGHGDN